jgi:hypothetical protein
MRNVLNNRPRSLRLDQMKLPAGRHHNWFTDGSLLIASTLWCLPDHLREAAGILVARPSWDIVAVYMPPVGNYCHKWMSYRAPDCEERHHHLPEWGVIFRDAWPDALPVGGWAILSSLTNRRGEIVDHLAAITIEMAFDEARRDVWETAFPRPKATK